VIPWMPYSRSSSIRIIIILTQRGIGHNSRTNVKKLVTQTSSSDKHESSSLVKLPYQLSLLLMQFNNGFIFPYLCASLRGMPLERDGSPWLTMIRSG